MLGGDSLQELRYAEIFYQGAYRDTYSLFSIDIVCYRSAFILADQERQGGISPHISPFMNVPDAGNVLVSSGFQLCTGTI